MKWIDAPLRMRANAGHWPGDPDYTVADMMSMERGNLMDVTAISMCSHFGTHIDAPKHYVKAGNTVDALPADLNTGS